MKKAMWMGMKKEVYFYTSSKSYKTLIHWSAGRLWQTAGTSACTGDPELPKHKSRIFSA
jgi:hypothetical protein